MEKFFDEHNAAKLLGCSRQTIRRLYANKILEEPLLKIGEKRKINLWSVDQLEKIRSKIEERKKYQNHANQVK